MGSEYAKQSDEDAARKYYDMMQCGVLFYRDDHLCMPGEIADLVCESGGYMADYVIGKDGKLCEIRFDKVSDPGMPPGEKP